MIETSGSFSDTGAMLDAVGGRGGDDRLERAGRMLARERARAGRAGGAERRSRLVARQERVQGIREGVCIPYRCQNTERSFTEDLPRPRRAVGRDAGDPEGK